MEESYKNDRYPGGKPFISSQSSVFFGRENDIKKIVLKLATERFIVLFSKSGIGKTSLINAGLIPYFRENYGAKCDIIKIRFNAGPDENRTPVEMFVENTNINHTVLNHIPVLSTSLWQALKSRQFDDKFENNKQYLIILDQFEELFNHSDKDIEDFKVQLSNLYNNKVPNDFNKTLKRELLINKELEDLFYETDLEDKLLAKIPIKVLISIRSDKLSLLNRLKDYFPELLLNCFELQPLDTQHARDAIVRPAQLEGDFLSPKFQYSNKALECIIDFLSARNKKWIESFQLQVICQYIEENVKKFNIDQVEEHHISGHLKEVIRAYYEKEINKIAKDNEYGLLRGFIEERLILAKERRRVSLDEGSIKDELGENLSQRFFKSNLLRSEPNNQGGCSFELSHDSLVEPILISKFQREAEEGKEKAKLQQKQKLKRILITSTFIILGVIAASYYFFNAELKDRHEKEMERKLSDLQTDYYKQKELYREATLIINSLDNSKSNNSETNKKQLDSLKNLLSYSLTDYKVKFNKQKAILADVSTSASTVSSQMDVLIREKESISNDLNRMREENARLSGFNSRYEQKDEELRRLAVKVQASLRELGVKIDTAKYLNNTNYPNDAYVRRISHWYQAVNDDLKNLNTKMLKKD